MLPFPLSPSIFNWHGDIKRNTRFLYLSQDVYLMMIVFSSFSLIVFLLAPHSSQSVKHDA